MWHSWIRAVSLSGTSSTWSHWASAGSPAPPSTPTVTIPISRAAASARTTFAERPEVVMANSTSPFRPSPRSGRSNTRS